MPDTAPSGSRARNREARRARILDAAEALIAQGGADALVMRRIAQDAGTTPRTVYAIFGSKEALLRALFARATGLADLMDRPPQRSLLHMIDDLGVFLDRITEKAGLMRPLVHALQYAGLNDERLDMEDRMAVSFGQVLERARLQGVLSGDVAPSLLAQQIVLTFIQGLRRWAQRGLPDSTLRAHVLFGILLLLTGTATEKGQAELRPLLLAQQAAILDLTDAAGAPSSGR